MPTINVAGAGRADGRVRKGSIVQPLHVVKARNASTADAAMSEMKQQRAARASKQCCAYSQATRTLSDGRCMFAGRRHVC